MVKDSQFPFKDEKDVELVIRPKEGTIVVSGATAAYARLVRKELFPQQIQTRKGRRAKS